jgi:hypothetical protein
MSRFTQIVLDVLKPHQPSILVLTHTLAERCSGLRVAIDVEAVDEKTESVIIQLDGEDIDFEGVSETLSELGASVHSIDRVEAASNNG